MSERNVLRLISVLAVSLLVAAASAGCTPESPPLPALTGESHGVQSSEEQSQESPAKTDKRGDTSSEESSAGSSAAERSRESTYSSEFGLWDEAVGSPVTVNYKFFGEGDTVEAQTTVPWLMNDLAEAVSSMRIVGETDHFAYDSNETLSFWDNDGKSFSLEFSGGTLMKDNAHYEVTGYPELKTLLNELRENYSGENMEESFVPFTKQELADMETVGDRLRQLTDSEEYDKASLGERRKMAVDLLNELADEGLVIRESILAPDDNDSVSFRYSSDVLGGIMLREWDPMMN